MITGLIQRIYAQNESAPDPDTISNSILINTNIDDVQGLITLIISWIIYFAAILAFIYLVISGITYITAGGNAEQAKKGQAGIINAVIGIIIIVLAFVILKAVSGIAGGQ